MQFLLKTGNSYSIMGTWKPFILPSDLAPVITMITF